MKNAIKKARTNMIKEAEIRRIFGQYGKSEFPEARHSNHEFFKHDFSDTEIKQLSHIGTINVVMFDGYISQLKKIAQLQKETNNTEEVMGQAYIIPPSGFFTENDIMEFNKRTLMIPRLNLFAPLNTVSSPSLNSHEILIDYLTTVKNTELEIATTFSSYLLGGYRFSWDDRRLYRIYGIIGFLNQNRYKTLGEYLVKEDAAIQKKVSYSDFSEFREYIDFVNNALDDANILGWRGTITKKSEKLIFSLNKDEIIQLMSREKETVPQNKYTAKVQEAVDIVRTPSTITKNELFKTLTEASSKISQRSEYWDNELFFEANTVGQEAVSTCDKYIKNGISPDFAAIVDMIDKNYSKMTIMDLVVLLKWFPRTNYLIRSGDLDKSMRLARLAIDNLDEPIYFVKFLTRLFLLHDGVIPSFTEWRKHLELIDRDENYSIPINLILPLIVPEMKATSSMRENEAVVHSIRNSYKHIILPEDEDR